MKGFNVILLREEPELELQQEARIPSGNRKSKLAGYDAWADIPEYLKADININFYDYKALYKIESIFNINCVLDYSSMVSPIGYSDRLIPGKVVPIEGIQIWYYATKATGNMANYRCPTTIEPRYPRKAELNNLLHDMRETCKKWERELIHELDHSTAEFLLTDFMSFKMTTKDLKPTLKKVVDAYLKRLYLRLDNIVASHKNRFRGGREFGYYSVSRDF